MNVDLFDFELPDAQIALRPLPVREQAKLLHIDPQAQFHDAHIGDLPKLIKARDVLVFNDTKVIAAALEGKRLREDAPAIPIHINLHQRIKPAHWLAFARPARRLRLGDTLIFAHHDSCISRDCAEQILRALIVAKGQGGEVELEFNQSGEQLDASIASLGQMPLPPYIAAKRQQDVQDVQDYQTIFARAPGAVAAPTAGLHFTPQLLHALHHADIETYFLTLHVGAGTFLPVKGKDTRDHSMHFEEGYIDEITAKALNTVKARGGRIIAVGTTVLRLLESATNAQGYLEPFSGRTDIFITPGYNFRFVDRLLTNFHLPRSTLFMLVCAFCGLQTMQQAYAHAISHHYRFYSYGDACLLDHSNCADLSL